MQTSSKLKPDRRRSGVAAAEFAVCLPILMVLMVGTIEACSMIYLKQTLSVAAYEAARASTVPNATSANVQAAADAVLTARRVVAPVVTIKPKDFDKRPADTWTTITVSAPGATNSIIPGWFYDDQNISAKACMLKEFE